MKIAVYLLALTLSVVGLHSNAQSKDEKENDDKYKDFSHPVFFAVDDSEVKVKSPKIIYDLRAGKGFSLVIADSVFNNDSLKVQIIETGALQVSWDKHLVDGGDLSIIDTYGKELWKIKVDNSGDWKFTDWKGKNIPQWKSGDHFRFCLRSEKDKGFASICTQSYGVEIADQKITLDYTKSPTPARLIVMNEEKKIWKGEVEATIGAPAQFLATIKTGATYEFMSEPAPLNLKDIIAGEQEN
ncbi:MAG: hypothetical protein J7501_12450, partial [Bdellovibrio sp.]|nr:hypothetical protein [Bdellovibrio sp.]